MVIASSSENDGTPSSLTCTVNVYEPGPCASVGVQENAPVDALIAAPDGAPIKLNVSVLAGSSGSAALAAKSSAVSSSTVRFPIAASDGARLTSLTVMVTGA